MDTNTIITIALAVFVIVRSIIWEEKKEKLNIRLENIEKEIAQLKGEK